MPRCYTNDGVQIAKQMKDHLNGWESKPCEICLEAFDKNPPSMMIQQLAAAEKKQIYVNGSYIGVWNFALCIRVDGTDTASRLDATACLNDIAEWLEQRNPDGVYVNLPTLDDRRTAVKIEMSTSPSISARYEDGTEDYQAVFALEYKVRRI